MRLYWQPPLFPGGTINRYMVRQSTSISSGWVTIAYVSGSTRTINMTGLRAGITYYFRIAAINGAGAGAYNPTVSAVPKAPICPSATAGTPGGADPWGGCWPGPTTTGVPAGVQLSVFNGALVITTAGTVIDGRDIRGCVVVRAPNVTIRRSRVTCSGAYAILNDNVYPGGGSLVVEDVDIDCGNASTTGIGDAGVIARRVEIRRCENGFDIDSDFTVEDSYIYDFYDSPAAHTDGIQLAGGANIIISHNSIFNPGGTSSIISHPNKNSNVLVKVNLLAGGAYTLYCPTETSVNFRVIDNNFSKAYSPLGGAYGPWTACERVAENRGNVWAGTNIPVPL